jgi:hypothetical protein
VAAACARQKDSAHVRSWLIVDAWIRRAFDESTPYLLQRNNEGKIMKLKKEYLILIIVIAAIGLYLATRSLNQNNNQLPQPAKLENAKINRLLLTDKKSAPLELVKKDEHWFIEPKGYPADDAKIKNMINSICNLKLTALVSESGSYDRYGLSPDQKIYVQAFSDGTAVRAFSIGKAASTYRHTFVELKGDRNVYHARGELVHTFDQNVSSLRDKTIFNVDKAGITEVTLKKNDKELTLDKKEVAQKNNAPEAKKDATPKQAPPTEWQAADGGAVEQDVVDRLLGEIDHLDCDAFLKDDAKTQLGKAIWTITFKKGQKERSLSLYPKLNTKDDKLPATASTTQYAFYLKQYRINNIDKNMNKLLGIKEQKK